ncbi:MAG: hypothetical protein EOO50_11535 [Flavobacterium sp.]|uniref:hypothetical protein n=1 Tax=Flavobacterium sp. TaxID=239 RepID=UPI0012164B70|nr:hypothetical protein [Flavobacterium sp.]RZJ66036.1 MAG: hypothetical protein EOO50_11535 [Flavobacterium sp.]
MIFEFKFNPTAYRTQFRETFNHMWGKVLKQRNYYFIGGAIITALGIFAVVGKSNFGYLFIFISFGLWYWGCRLHLHFYDNRKKYERNIEETISNYPADGIIIWEFQPDHFIFKDYRMETKMLWSVFSGYRMIGKNMVLESKVGIGYSLAADEIGKEDFEKVITFLNTKTKKLTT